MKKQNELIKAQGGYTPGIVIPIISSLRPDMLKYIPLDILILMIMKTYQLLMF